MWYCDERWYYTYKLNILFSFESSYIYKYESAANSSSESLALTFSCNNVVRIISKTLFMNYVI